jgi:hypothetical protein
MLFVAAEGLLASSWTGGYVLLKRLVSTCQHSQVACFILACVSLILGLPLYFMALRYVGGWLYHEGSGLGADDWLKDLLRLAIRSGQSVLAGDADKLLSCKPDEGASDFASRNR